MIFLCLSKKHSNKKHLFSKKTEKFIEAPKKFDFVMKLIDLERDTQFLKLNELILEYFGGYFSFKKVRILVIKKQIESVDLIK